MINQSAESPGQGYDKFNQNMNMNSGLEDGDDDIDFYNNLKRAVVDDNDEDDIALDMDMGNKQPDDLIDDDDQYDDGDFINDDSQGEDVMGFM